MKERPIIFSSEMVRAILGGRKTQTRRVIKPQPPRWVWSVYKFEEANLNLRGSKHLYPEVPDYWVHCPYGQPGDRLWVRETFSPYYFDAKSRNAYRADWTLECGEFVPEPKWTPSIFMPRWASRITLEVTGVRVQPLRGISGEDVLAEGCGKPIGTELVYGHVTEAWNKRDFSIMWDKLNAKRGYSWAKNPWVWVVEFKRVEEQD